MARDAVKTIGMSKGDVVIVAGCRIEALGLKADVSIQFLDGSYPWVTHELVPGAKPANAFHVTKRKAVKP